MKKIILSSIFAVFAFAFALYLGNLDEWSDKSVDIPVTWEHRSPASLTENLDFQVFNDLFSLKSFDKKVHYVTDFEVWTDKDGQYLQDKAKEALHKGLAQTIYDIYDKKKIGEEIDAKGTLKDNIIASFMDTFIKTLYIVKIMNGTFQVDIKFIPKNDTQDNFAKELSSNQLVNFGEENKFSDYLAGEEGTIPENILKANIPVSDELYQYLGGGITLWIKVLDLSYNPLKIPNPPKNAVKGFVRFRRFFRINQTDKLRLDIKSDNIKITQQYIKSRKDQQFLTADLYYSFNLKGVVPMPDRIEVTPGVMLPIDKRGGNFFSRLFSKKEEKIKSGKFKLEGTAKYPTAEGGEEDHKFDLSINKITLDLTKDNASPTLSVYVNGGFLDSSEEFEFEQMVRHKISEQIGKELLTKLQFDRFFSKLK